MALSKAALIEKTLLDRLVKLRREAVEMSGHYINTLDFYDFLCQALSFFDSISLNEFTKALDNMKRVGLLEIHAKNIRLSDQGWERHQRQQAAAQGGQAVPRA